MSQFDQGGGATLIWTLSQIFAIFYFDASPNSSFNLSFTTSPGGGWCDIYDNNAILNSVVVEVEVWVELGNNKKEEQQEQEAELGQAQV